MFQELLDKTELTIDERELQLPVSVDETGSIVTLAELVDEKAPVAVRRALGRWPSEPRHRQVRQVRNLSSDELRVLAEATLEVSDPTANAAIVGQGDFSTKELLDEVRRETDVGRRLVEAVRTHSLFIESAIEAGKVHVVQPQVRVILPEFDF